MSPFHHVGLVPVQRLHVVAAAVMVGVAGVLAVAAVALFGRRDLQAR